MQRYYKGFKHDRQRQIDDLLSVYDYIGKANRKKELPKNKTDGIKQGGVMHGRAQENK